MSNSDEYGDLEPDAVKRATVDGNTVEQFSPTEIWEGKQAEDNYKARQDAKFLGNMGVYQRRIGWARRRRWPRGCRGRRY